MTNISHNDGFMLHTRSGIIFKSQNKHPCHKLHTQHLRPPRMFLALPVRWGFGKLQPCTLVFTFAVSLIAEAALG